jgi:L-ascorbate metabolism protein UlaG (beta-lactamase superfamily)
MHELHGFSVTGASLGLLAAAAGGGGAGRGGPELRYFGRSSIKIRTSEGFVIYVDPYAPGDYSEPADLILVTHGHGDHNQVKLVARKPGTVVAAPEGAVSGKGVRVIVEGEHLAFGPVTVKALPASNKNHQRGETLGYLMGFDGIKVYHAGDTSWLPEMAAWASFGINYALMPCDGFYNMGPEEASRCAQAIGAKCVIPIHSSKDGYYDAKNAQAVKGGKVVVLEPGGRVMLAP